MIKRPTTNLGPHIGTIKFNIYIQKMNPDHSIDTQIVDCSDLFKDHEITELGEIHVIGFDKWECVRKIKEKLESLSGT